MIDIPGYEIKSTLGHGGMATVYLAIQHSLMRPVALKVLAPSLARDTVAKERFLREARFAANLHHPNIVEIYDIGEHNDTPYMAMAYEPGGTVATLTGKPVETETALRIIRDIAVALDHAHSHGVVHRDVKPDNILRSENGACVLTDFGIALAASAQTHLTSEGTSVGTPHYMSPEQLRGENVDGRADLYSLGVVLFQLLTGQLPYNGADGWAIGMQHLSAPIPPLPAELARLQPLINALLAKKPAARPATSADVVRSIDACLTGDMLAMADALPATTALQSLPRTLASKKALIALFATLTLALTWALTWGGDIGRADSTALPTPAVTAAINTVSIAVLPFRDMSRGQDQGYFSDGLTEELLNLLAQVPQLRVAGRTSTFAFKGKIDDLRRIRSELHVANVLEGSVRHEGNRLRITVQLINSENGFRIWSQSYDRALDDVFKVQEDIAAAVVGQLKIKLLGAAPKVHKANPRAYPLFLQAKQLAILGTAEGYAQSVVLFQQALAIDPRYVAAWVGLANTYRRQSETALRPIKEGYQLARDALNKAQSIDPDFAQAHTEMAWIALNYDNDLLTAARQLERALTLEPADLKTITNAAVLSQDLGQLDQAIALAEFAVNLDPINPRSHGNLGLDYLSAGRLDDAIASFRSALALSPKRIIAHYNIGVAMLLKHENNSALAEMQLESDESFRLMGLAMAYHAQGKQSQSDAKLAELIAKYQQESAYNIAYVQAFRNQKDEAFEWLEKAVTYHDPGLSEIVIEPLFANIRHDPRWLKLLQKLGKSPEQLAAIRFKAMPPSTIPAR